MSTLVGVIKEIEDIDKLTRMKGNDRMINGLVESVATKISTIGQWDTSAAVQLTSAIVASGVKDAHKTRLETACDDRTASYAQMSMGPKRSGGGHHLATSACAT